MIHRREFLASLGLGAMFALSPQLAVATSNNAAASAASSGSRRLLVLVELKGGNDGLNTIVPFSDPRYLQLRPRIGLKRDEVLRLDERTGAHPALAPLQPLWDANELAIVQSVGYPQPNLSHFRSIEIWDTASRSDQYLDEGWLGRAFARFPGAADAAADSVAVGGGDLGPLAGRRTRAVALSGADQFQRLARNAGGVKDPGGSNGNSEMGAGRSGALSHLLKVESDVSAAATRLAGSHAFSTAFPGGPFGDAVRTACQVVARSGGVAAIRLTLNGFDTHRNQPGTHANLLRQLAEGLVALRAGLAEIDRWRDSLVMTYAEFGRRPQENESSGTDHGTAAPQLVLGGRVRGGLHGEPPRLDRLDGNGNQPFAVDFRQLYATALEGWWGIPSADILGGRFAPLPFLRV